MDSLIILCLCLPVVLGPLLVLAAIGEHAPVVRATRREWCQMVAKMSHAATRPTVSLAQHIADLLRENPGSDLLVLAFRMPDAATAMRVRRVLDEVRNA